MRRRHHVKRPAQKSHDVSTTKAHTRHLKDGVAATGHLRGRTVPTRPSLWLLDGPIPSGYSSADMAPQSLIPSELDSFITQAALPPPIIAPTTSDCYSLGSAAISMDYHRQNLAGLMVWLDSKGNDYRRKVVPLAANQPAIGLAIMAFALQHCALASPDVSIMTVAEDARNKCLQLIQWRAQNMTANLIAGCDSDQHDDMLDAEWMLPPLLIMTNYENARCLSHVADGHRQAACTIVKILKNASWNTTHDLFDFLLKQLAIDNILAATTSFNPTLIKNALTSAPGSNHQLF
ncbi:fungal transcriptional regulatory protein [Colletotrichum incanum]|uniref:Fungal transcriptional regulatory protein n=1 Tax=Colletotrichum incanum TaxID=1573173 RepID=A0A161Y9E2_COLIC|nr:fungal transcriptional regulatory protein [Colletotrichum incanum]